MAFVLICKILVGILSLSFLLFSGVLFKYF